MIYTNSSRWSNGYQLNTVLEDIYKKLGDGHNLPSCLYWLEPVSTKEQLPLDAKNGTVGLVLSELKLYVLNNGKYVDVNVKIDECTQEEIESIFNVE